jgi:hypothetical protein
MGDVGTFQWRAGPKAVDDKDIKPGTAIATFDSKGRYPGEKDPNKKLWNLSGARGEWHHLDFGSVAGAPGEGTKG